ncbi:MAG: hypothetical protein IPK78_07660 [Rhodospirillales bacterium]|nr:hypothetical protein [Rhodospirillales bacterium]
MWIWLTNNIKMRNGRGADGRLRFCNSPAEIVPLIQRFPKGEMVMNARDDMASKDVEALRQEMAQLRNDFSAMTQTLKDIAGDAGSEAYARVRERAGQARVQAEKAADQVTHSIEERPFTSVLVAFALGLLMGVLFGRQR